MKDPRVKTQIIPRLCRDILAAAHRGDNNALSKLINSEENGSLASKITLLYAACQQGDHQTATILLYGGAINPNEAGPLGETPLFTACEWGHRRLVEILLAKDDTDIHNKSDSGESPLSIALDKKNDRITKILIQKITEESIAQKRRHSEAKRAFITLLLCQQRRLTGTCERNTYNPFSTFCTSLPALGKIQVVRFLTLPFVDVFSRHYTPEQCRKTFKTVCLENMLRSAQHLLGAYQNGHFRPDLIQPDKSDRTPILFALTRGHWKIVDLISKRKHPHHLLQTLSVTAKNSYNYRLAGNCPNWVTNMFTRILTNPILKGHRNNLLQLAHTLFSHTIYTPVAFRLAISRKKLRAPFDRTEIPGRIELEHALTACSKKGDDLVFAHLRQKPELLHMRAILTLCSIAFPRKHRVLQPETARAPDFTQEEYSLLIYFIVCRTLKDFKHLFNMTLMPHHKLPEKCSSVDFIREFKCKITQTLGAEKKARNLFNPLPAYRAKQEFITEARPS